MKTEPSTYSFADLQREGKAVWDGITNNLALKHLRQMRKGDLVMIYHTGDEKSIIGVAEVVRDPYPDPTAKNATQAVVDIRALRPLGRMVPLAEVKKNPRYSSFDLVRNSRLSVMPVEKSVWNALIRSSTIN